jgi:4'-phosphopantetheinyl transferase
MTAGLPADVFLVLLEQDDPRAEQWERWLSADERTLLATFTHESRRRAFRCGRAAARLAIHAATGLPPDGIIIRINDTGAVSVSDSALHLSITHSGNFAAAAVSARNIGIDLERDRAVNAGLLDRIASAEDRSQLNESGLPRPALACWTLKEAVLKGLGAGLRIAPSSLSLSLTGETAFIATPQGGIWEARIRSTPDYLLAVSWALSDS